MNGRLLRALSLVLLVLAVLPVSAEPRSFKSSILRVPPQKWLQDFRGILRVWRCDWLLDNEAAPVPHSMSVKVLEYRLIDQGYDQMYVRWRFPFREDLTPNLSYYRCTSEHTVVVSGNDTSGPRAVVSASPDTGVDKTAIVEFISNPLAAFAHGDLYESVAKLNWEPLGQEQISPQFLQSDRRRGSSTQDAEGVSVGCFAGESMTLDASWQQLRAQIICPCLQMEKRAQLDSTAHAGAAWLWPLIALDMRAETDGGQRPEWAGSVESSYRVLEWQQAYPSDTPSEPGRWQIPRLAVWEEICERPQQSSKSYHRMALVLIDIESNPDLQLIGDWQSILPRMRIADTTTGRACVGGAKVAIA